MLRRFGCAVASVPYTGALEREGRCGLSPN